MTGAEIEMEARSFIGVRYRHQGRSREGVDCIGLPVLVRERLGLATPPVALNYAPLPTDEAMLDFCKLHMRAVDRGDLHPGDVVVMSIGVARHMGIVATYVHGGLSLLHARSRHPRRVSETQFTDAWLRSEGARVLGCFRFSEVDQ